jgi:fructan beta-fructosidase
MKDTVVRLIAAAAAITVAALTLTAVPLTAAAQDAGYLNETYRPQYHYTAEKNMINDPNGLVYMDGEYHLFHQYNVHDTVEWGHAVSTDLVHWTRLAPALFPDAIGQIFSGAVVVDDTNSSGLQTGTTKVMVAVFSYGQHSGPQSQGLAYSNDKGRTWSMYSGNPIMPNTGQADFRDPSIFWNAATSKWNMVLTVGKTLNFYTSTNLKSWTLASNWGTSETHPGNWECPNIFPMTVPGTSTTKWVLSVSQDQGAPGGGVGMRYFTGNFDGTTFTPDTPGAAPLWQNYGKDYYAGITFNNVPATDGRRLMVAWNDDWQYRFDTPTTPFNGQLSLVRDLKLQQFPEGLRLTENPVSQYTSIRGTASTWGAQTLTPTTNLLSNTTGDALEIIAKYDTTGATATSFGINVRKGKNQSTPVGYNMSTSSMYVDRTNSGVTPNPTGTSPNPNWSVVSAAPLTPVNGTVTLHIFVDRSSVEAFGNDREQISDLIFPDQTSVGLETFATGGNVKLTSLTVYPLGRAWPTASPIVSNVSNWSTVQGDWADTQSGREGSAVGLGTTLSSATASDFTYTATATVQGVRPGDPKPIIQEAAAGLLFRSDDTAKHAYLAQVNAKTDTVDLLKIDGDTTTVLASTPRSLATNTAYALSVHATGTQISVSVDGTQVINTTDSTYRSGRVGLSVQDSDSYLQNINLTPTTNLVTNLSGLTTVSGTWTYQTTGIQGSSSGDAFQMSADTATDFSYQAGITVSETGGARAGTLVFRSNDAGTQGYGLNLDAGADVVTFFRWGSPGATIATYPTTVNTGTTYVLKVDATGSTFTISLNGVVLGTPTDTTYSSGKLGLNVFNSTTTFQNVTVSRHPASWASVAGTWTPTTAGWQGNGASDAFLMSNQQATNFTYSSTVRVSGSTGGGSAAALMFRANANATQGYVANIDAANDVVTLFRFDSGGNATTIKRYVYSIDTDRNYELKVRAVDNHLSVYLDGRLVIDTLDNTYTTGQIGLNVYNSQSTLTNITMVPDRNLVTNPGFEYGDLRGWTEWHPTTQAAAFGVDGNDVQSGSSKLYFFSGSAYEESVHQLITALPNGSYTASAWVKLNQAATTARMEISNNGNPVNVNITPGASYQLISTPVTVSNGQVDIGFYVNAPANTSLQIDAVSITKN